ncbi:MAG: hypothetical protein LBP87_07240 [Planctomycetaceae bacterium]|jgi:hypothetical protein|nr:hypothetical protein [Planctomycetaceae bacterium]
MKLSSTRWITGVLLFVIFTALSVSPATAQPGRFHGPPPPPHHHHHHGPSDFDKALGVIGAVGAVAAIANGYSPYGYYRRSPSVVVVPQRPSTVVVERPIIVEKPVVVERQVLVEKTVPATPVLPADYYSPKLGTTFIIQNMKIPGYTFTAARLTSNPIEGSPLNTIGLRKGDVITRLDNAAVDSLEELERHEKNTLIRYIKTGTTKVQLAKIYIPTDSELSSNETDTFYAP